MADYHISTTRAVQRAWTVIEGAGIVTLNGSTREYKEGETILIPQELSIELKTKFFKTYFN